MRRRRGENPAGDGVLALIQESASVKDVSPEEWEWRSFPHQVVMM